MIYLAEKDHSKKVILSNIQRFSTHDGPGIRTVAFFKGCPLRCPWCCNPETQSKSKIVMQTKIECLKCRKCIYVCPKDALREQNDVILVDSNICDLCGKCVEICPTSNIQIIGKEYTVKELTDELLKDKVFYDRTDGGVTFSGGEPTLHTDFLIKLSKVLKTYGLHIAMETCGYFNYKTFTELLPLLDLILFDLKIIDKNLHKRDTGKPNDIIFSNLKNIVDSNKKVIIRFPVIPGYTDNIENINGIIDTMRDVGLKRIDIIPYHRFSESKYERLGMQYALKGIIPSIINDKVKHTKIYFEKAGMIVRVGG